jgi:hypothetical protein
MTVLSELTFDEYMGETFSVVVDADEIFEKAMGGMIVPVIKKISIPASACKL